MRSLKTSCWSAVPLPFKHISCLTLCGLIPVLQGWWWESKAKNHLSECFSCDLRCRTLIYMLSSWVCMDFCVRRKLPSLTVIPVVSVTWILFCLLHHPLSYRANSKFKLIYKAQRHRHTFSLVICSNVDMPSSLRSLNTWKMWWKKIITVLGGGVFASNKAWGLEILIVQHLSKLNYW